MNSAADLFRVSVERERIKRETEMRLEEEETQQDMKDAMEALKLKEIKDRQKDARKEERRRLGLESLKEVEPERSGELESKYEKLEKIAEDTGKKFLKNKYKKRGG